MSAETETTHKKEAEKHKRFRIRPAYVILAVLLVFFAFKFLQKTQEIRALKQQETALRYENQQTAAENARLQRAIGYYHTTNYIENEARAIFGYTKPGEVAIQSRPRPAPAVAVRAAPPARPPAPVPVWKQWWRTFFG